jgi:hypothetical protein
MISWGSRVRVMGRDAAAPNGLITNVSASSLMSDSEVVINVKGFVTFYLNKVIRIVLTSF